jgi:hypothetical protein
MIGRWRLLFSLVLLCFLSLPARAMKPFLEPYIGISKFEVTQETTFVGSSIPSKDQVVNNGFHLGARVGVLFGKSYTLFGEYFQGGPYADTDIVSVSSAEGTKLTNRMYGVGAGANFDIISLSAAFFIKNMYDLADSEETERNDKAVRIGLSLPVSKKEFLRANLDVFIHLLEDSESTSGSSTSELSATTTAVSLSFPFDF